MKKTVLYTALMASLYTAAYADTPPAPATAAPAEQSAPTTTPSTVPAPQPDPTALNCEYRLPAETQKVDQTLVSTWSSKAAVQSFNFNPAEVDQQLDKLKACFTDQGWQSFSEALEKSGNVNSIKTQHLTVSSQVDGNVSINPVKDNQWKVTVPMQVVYQNDKEKITQLLTVDLLIGRKVSGDLGILQMIATPRTPMNTLQPAAGTENAPAPAEAPKSN